MSAPAASPLDPEQLRVLKAARVLGSKLRLARGIALTNVISLALLAFLSLLGGLFSLSLSPVAIALALLAYNEERGRRLLRAVDARAPSQLAQNQLLLFVLVLVYCAVNAYSAWTGPDPLSALNQLSTEFGDELNRLTQETGGNLSELGNLARVASLLVYGVVLAVSFVVQGLTALYYRSLQRTLDALEQVPAWAKELANLTSDLS